MPPVRPSGSAGRAPGARESTAAGRAFAAVWIVLALLAAARAALALTPSTWAWSLALPRFLAPLPGWGLWLLATLALAPPAARRAAPALARLGDLLARRPGLASLSCAAAAAALVWLLPDRVGFVGDFRLRENTLGTEGLPLAEWYPQALPLDLAIHHHLARALMVATGLGVVDAGRLIGACDAALLGWIAVRFASALELGGVAAVATSTAVFWTGALTLFTGYNKGFAEMALLVAAVGTFGLTAIRSGGGVTPLLLVAAAGFTLHRSALGVLPALGLALAWALRGRGRERLRRPATWMGLAAVALSLAFMMPRVLRIVRDVDPVHFLPAGAGGSVWSAAFGGARPADMLNLIVMLAPLALAGFAGLAVLGPAAWRRREPLLLAVLALPFVAVIPFVHAQQGLFRDWDDFVSAGIAVSLLAAWCLGELLRARAGRAWLAVPVCLAALVPSLQWLIHQTSAERGLARVRTFVQEPPSRSAFERAMTWQYLGAGHLALGRGPEGADAYAEAARLLSSPHLLRQWGVAEMLANRPDRALAVFDTLLARVPDDWTALRGILLLATQRGDWSRARVAAESLRRAFPDDAQATETLRMLERGGPGEARRSR